MNLNRDQIRSLEHVGTLAAGASILASLVSAAAWLLVQYAMRRR